MPLSSLLDATMKAGSAKVLKPEQYQRYPCHFRGQNRTGRGTVVKLEKQNSFVTCHMLNKPELFCHPQTEWEYFFSYLSGIKNSHPRLPMPKHYCLGFKQMWAQMMIQ